MIIEFLGSMLFDAATVLSVHLSATRMIRAGGRDCRRIPSRDLRMYDSSLWAQISTVTSTDKGNYSMFTASKYTIAATTKKKERGTYQSKSPPVTNTRSAPRSAFSFLLDQSIFH